MRYENKQYTPTWCQHTQLMFVLGTKVIFKASGLQIICRRWTVGIWNFLFQDDFLFSVSILSGILCTILAVLKFMLGKVLTSRALITDGELGQWARSLGVGFTVREDAVWDTFSWLSYRRAQQFGIHLSSPPRILNDSQGPHSRADVPWEFNKFFMNHFYPDLLNRVDWGSPGS